MPHSLNRSIAPVIAAAMLIFASAAHGRTFISPMGEPFRATPGGADPAEAWFAGVDKNSDGRLTRAEFLADAGRFFIALDVDHDKEIGPEEIDRYEQEVAPEIQTDGFGAYSGGESRGPRGGGGHGKGRGGGGRRGGGGGGGGGEDGAAGGASSEDHPGPAEPPMQGAARFGYLALPEPITAADTDFNRGISMTEFTAAANERFNLLDTNHDGVITRDDLAGLRRPSNGGRRTSGRRSSTNP